MNQHSRIYKILFNIILKSWMYLMIKPVIYENPLINKTQIWKENENKCGIYKWTNKITLESYIGSSINLKRRFKNYFSNNYLERKINSGKIYKNIVRYGISNFRLEVLEYCDNNSIISREQYYMNYFNPEYNILKLAGSTLGFKHSTETKLKFKCRRTRRGNITRIVNKQTGLIEEYPSIRAAARFLKVNYSSLLNYVNQNILFYNKYYILNPNNTNSLYSKNRINIKVLDINNNSSLEFTSFRLAAKHLGNLYGIIISSSTISSYLKTGKIYKNRFLFLK